MDDGRRLGDKRGLVSEAGPIRATVVAGGAWFQRC